MKQPKRRHEKLQTSLTAQMAKVPKKSLKMFRFFFFDVILAMRIWGNKKKVNLNSNGNDFVMQNVYLHLLSFLLSCPTMCTQSGGRRSCSRNRSRTCGRTSSFCGRITMEKYNLYLDRLKTRINKHFYTFLFFMHHSTFW